MCGNKVEALLGNASNAEPLPKREACERLGSAGKSSSMTVWSRKQLILNPIRFPVVVPSLLSHILLIAPIIFSKPKHLSAPTMGHVSLVDNVLRERRLMG